MKNALLLFVFLLLNCSLSFSQATVQDTIAINDGSVSKTLTFGIDPAASDTLDESLGEADLPPAPPAGTFDVRFLLPAGNFDGSLSSWKDYRNASFPFSGTKEFRIKYQVGSGTVINLAWNFPPKVTGVLNDIITGSLINVSMNGSGNYQVTNPGAFSQLKMTITYDAVTPVELTAFSAYINAAGVNLKWTTASETNNLGFDIQRQKTSGNNVKSGWEKIGFVNGSGNSVGLINYSFIDDNAAAGRYSYRLKQIDLDGGYKYSEAINVSINIPSRFSLIQNYPNPFNPSTTISFSIPEQTKVQLNIYNVLGQKISQLVNEVLDAGIYNVKWNAGDRSSGIYFYELKTGSFSSIKKMILTK